MSRTRRPAFAPDAPTAAARAGSPARIGPLPAGLPGLSVAGVFLLALGVRLLHLWQMAGTPFFTTLLGDARSYDQWARRLAAGDWIGTDVFYQAPLYPYFLGVVYAVAGADPGAARLVQAAIGSASAALLCVAAARLFGARAGLIAGVTLALYAPAVFLDSLLQKSALDVFFVCAALAALAALLTGGHTHRRHWAALGLAAGALALTRENALVLVVVFAAWIWFAAPTGGLGRRRVLALFTAGVALVLAPVAARNFAVSGEVYLTTSQFGPNFYIGNNPGADGSYQSLRFGRGSPEFERLDATELAERASGRTLTPAEVSSYWTGRATSFITSQPGAWLALMARKTALLVNAAEAVDTESQESYAEWSWPLRALGWLMHFGVLVPLALVGVWATWDDRRRLAVFYAVALAFAASTIAFYVFARYRYPLVPILVLFASAGLAAIPRLRTTVPRPRLIAAAVVVVVVAGLCQWPLLSPTRSRAITDTNLATAFYEAGRHDQAITHYQRAIAVEPDYVPAYNNLGVTLRAAGRTDDAIRAYRDGLARRDDYPDLHFNLANALLAVHRPEEAATHLRKAAAGTPDSAGVHNNLGMALAEKGQFAEAALAFERAALLDPASSKAHRNLGNVLATLGNDAGAFEHLTRAAAVPSPDAEAHYDLGVFLLERDRNREAVTAFTAAIAARPGYAEAHNNLGIALGSLGNLDAAIAQFETALRLTPGFEDAARNLATARAARVR